MAYLEVIARAKVRPGQLEGVKAQAAEIVRVTREQDTHTLRCDWFINEDGTECEVHEMFPDEQGLIEHQMHIMEARTVLFRDYAYGHRFDPLRRGLRELRQPRQGADGGGASRLFVPAGTRTGGNGLATGGQNDRARRQRGAGVMANLEVHAHLKIRPGQLEGFKAQAAEIMRLTREQDTHTLRYDWFINEDGTECEVHEAYLSGQGLIEHNTHVMDARAILFEKYAYDHRMTVFGEISQELRELGNKHAGGIAVYTFLQGLQTAAAV